MNRDSKLEPCPGTFTQVTSLVDIIRDFIKELSRNVSGNTVERRVKNLRSSNVGKFYKYATDVPISGKPVQQINATPITVVPGQLHDSADNLYYVGTGASLDHGIHVLAIDPSKMKDPDLRHVVWCVGCTTDPTNPSGNGKGVTMVRVGCTGQAGTNTHAAGAAKFVGVGSSFFDMGVWVVKSHSQIVFTFDMDLRTLTTAIKKGDKMILHSQVSIPETDLPMYPMFSARRKLYKSPHRGKGKKWKRQPQIHFMFGSPCIAENVVGYKAGGEDFVDAGEFQQCCVINTDDVDAAE
jgi:hypothetical protein